MAWNSFRDLEVWQMGRQLVRDVYELSEKFPAKEQFGLTSQIRRAAVSIPANIAEGHGRRLDGAFTQFLRIASGSLNEVETLIILAIDVKIIDEIEASETLDAIPKLSVKISNLISTLGKVVREEPAIYNP